MNICIFVNHFIFLRGQDLSLFLHMKQTISATESTILWATFKIWMMKINMFIVQFLWPSWAIMLRVLYHFSNVFCRIKFQLPTAVTGLIIHYCILPLLYINIHFPSGLHLNFYLWVWIYGNLEEEIWYQIDPKMKSSG